MKVHAQKGWKFIIGTAEKYDFRKVHMQNDAKKVELSCAKFRFKEDTRAKRLEIRDGKTIQS